MQKILLIKAGEGAQELKEQWGDFEGMFIKKVGLSPKEFLVTKPYLGESVPPKAAEKFAGIIITGSQSHITEQEKWMEKLILHIKKIAQRCSEVGTPLLGVCFGHHLLAESLGGKVDFHPQGWEAGTVPINLTKAAAEDPLFQKLPSQFKVHAFHIQTVHKLPPSAVLLAQNDHDPHQAYRVNKNIWGTQFHPEFSAAIMKKCIDIQAEELRIKGKDPEQIKAKIQESRWGENLLKSFVKLAYS